MRSEKKNSDLFRLTASELGVLLWRNNTGAFKGKGGSFVRFGLANDTAMLNKNIKSSDLIGILPDGRFLAVEAKVEGWSYNPKNDRERAQKKFIDLVNSKGGVAFFCCDINDFKERLKNELRKTR